MPSSRVSSSFQFHRNTSDSLCGPLILCLRASYSACFVALDGVLQGNCSTAYLSSRQYPKDRGSSVAAFMGEGQCFILVDMKFMDLKQQFWMHGIYIRYTATSRSLARSENSMMSCSTSSCNLWMTNVRLQGGNARDPPQGGLEVTDGSVYGNRTVSTYRTGSKSVEQRLLLAGYLHSRKVEPVVVSTFPARKFNIWNQCGVHNIG